MVRWKSYRSAAEGSMPTKVKRARTSAADGNPRATTIKHPDRKCLAEGCFRYKEARSEGYCRLHYEEFHSARPPTGEENPAGPSSPSAPSQMPPNPGPKPITDTDPAMAEVTPTREEEPAPPPKIVHRLLANKLSSTANKASGEKQFTRERVPSKRKKSPYATGNQPDGNSDWFEVEARPATKKSRKLLRQMHDHAKKSQKSNAKRNGVRETKQKKKQNRPPTMYKLFVRKFHAKNKAEGHRGSDGKHVDYTVPGESMRAAAAAWRNLSEEDKAPYRQECERELLAWNKKVEGEKEKGAEDYDGADGSLADDGNVQDVLPPSAGSPPPVAIPFIDTAARVTSPVTDASELTGESPASPAKKATTANAPAGTSKHSGKVFQVGERVMATYRGLGRQYYPGTIAAIIEDARFTHAKCDIHFDDQDRKVVDVRYVKKWEGPSGDGGNANEASGKGARVDVPVNQAGEGLEQRDDTANPAVGDQRTPTPSDDTENAVVGDQPADGSTGNINVDEGDGASSPDDTLGERELRPLYKNDIKRRLKESQPGSLSQQFYGHLKHYFVAKVRGGGRLRVSDVDSIKDFIERFEDIMKDLRDNVDDHDETVIYSGFAIHVISDCKKDLAIEDHTHHNVPESA